MGNERSSRKRRLKGGNGTAKGILKYLDKKEHGNEKVVARETWEPMRFTEKKTHGI